MKIVEKNEGGKIAYKLRGTKLELADGALTIDLARYQQDTAVTKDVMVDNDGYLIMGRGRYYAAQITIPAAEYLETVTEQEEIDENEDAVMHESIERERLPLDTDKVILGLFSVDGIVIY